MSVPWATECLTDGILQMICKFDSNQFQLHNLSLNVSHFLGAGNLCRLWTRRKKLNTVNKIDSVLTLWCICALLAPFQKTMHCFRQIRNELSQTGSIFGYFKYSFFFFFCLKISKINAVFLHFGGFFKQCYCICFHCNSNCIYMKENSSCCSCACYLWTPNTQTCYGIHWLEGAVRATCCFALCALPPRLILFRISCTPNTPRHIRCPSSRSSPLSWASYQQSVGNHTALSGTNFL